MIFRYFNISITAYMNDVFKPFGQNNTTTRVSLLTLNQSLRKSNCAQNILSHIASNISNKLLDFMKITENLNTYKYIVKNHFFFFIEWKIRKIVFIATSDVCQSFTVNFHRYCWLSSLRSLFLFQLSFLTINVTFKITIAIAIILCQYYFL